MNKRPRKFIVSMGRLLGINIKGPFRRYLTRAAARNLADEINKILRTDLTLESILDTARKIRRIERKMIGRIAGDIDDHVLNYYLIRSTARKLPENSVFVEIGVLFGGSLLVIMEALRDAGVRRKVLAIDPLDSYYGVSEDPITLLPINKDTVLRNVGKANPGNLEFSLINMSSQLPQTIEALSGTKVAGIYIDGDHTYEGVKSDWRNYSQLVLPGGYILIDNYHDGYEGIDKFVDEEIIPDSKDWKVAGSVNRSIVFMKREKE